MTPAKDNLPGPVQEGSPRTGESSPLPPYRLIANQVAWVDCANELSSAARMAIDIEANSMYAYQERTCLIQVSTTGADYIIDPLAKIDLRELGAIIANPAVEKVFHAAEYDLILLQRDYGWQLNNLFDTVWAVRILGYRQIGLASLLERYFGVHTSKRFQKANWCHRPLSGAELSYAQKDTHYLLRLRDRLAAELEAKGHMAEAKEIFSEQSRVNIPENGFDPDAFWNINGTHAMTSGQQATLKALFIFRDREARRRDIPRFKVFGDRTLIELASELPRSHAELNEIYGMTERQKQRFAKPLLELIATTRDAPAPDPPKRSRRPSDSVLSRYDRLHQWRKARARKRGVESDVIMSRDALWTIAQNPPRSLEELSALDALGPWRLATYGRDVLDLI
jgi:ribonuclease D